MASVAISAIFDLLDAFLSDPLSMVKALEKSCKDGDMISEQEMLDLRVGDSLADARANFKLPGRKRKRR